MDNIQQATCRECGKPATTFAGRTPVCDLCEKYYERDNYRTRLSHKASTKKNRLRKFKDEY